MKKKLIALTVATAIIAATISVAGCAKDGVHHAMTEAEWQAAWQASYDISNYSVITEGQASKPVKVNKSDFEAGNYELPEMTASKPLTAKFDFELYQASEDIIVGTSSPDGNTTNVCTQLSFVEENIFYSFNNLDGEWKNRVTQAYDSADEAKEYFNSYYMVFDIIFSTLAESVGIDLINSYNSFTYDDKNDSYTGTLTSSYGEGNNIIMIATVKFNNG